MCNPTDNTKEFFMFSYFNIVPENVYKKNNELMKKTNSNYNFYIKRQCAYRAYLDLCRTLVVNKKKSNKERKEDVLEVCENLINEITNNLFNENNQNEFDESHKKMCKTLKNQLNNDKDLISDQINFSYGHAQKWLNMTLKYMWLLGLLKGDIEKYLHVPVDNYIIKAVWDKDGIELPLIEGKLLKDGSKGKYSAEKVKSWSQWDEKQYIDFQESLKDSLNGQPPLEWEHLAWIGNAE